MPDDRHNVAFVFGAILGGIAGAAVTLWKAPQSGAELRAELGQGFNDLTGNDQHSRHPPLESPIPGRTTPERLSSRALELAERAAAPIVGVKLGQTANESGNEPAPRAVGTPAAPVGTATPVSPAGRPVPGPPPADTGHAATTAELTHPTEADPTPISRQAAETAGPAPFPDLDKP